MTKNKLLIFTEYFLPAKKGGGPVSSIRNLVDLLHHDYEIGIVCFNHDMNETEPLGNITSNSWNNWKDKAKVYYIDRNAMSKKNIDELIAGFNPNTIYLNAIFVHQFILFPIWMAKKINAKVVIASRGMLQQGAIANKPIKKKIYFKIINLLGRLKNVNWHATDEQESKDIKQIFGSKNISIVNNVPIKPTQPTITEYSKIRIIYLSLITEKKNLHFLLEAFSEVTKQIVFDIYGPIKDKDYWQRCEAIIDTLPENIKVEYKGEIDPDKIGDVLPNYNLFVLPTLGENFGHAIFEAFANGIPVLISDRTPWRNLEKQNIGFDLDLDKNIWTEKINSLNIEQLNNMRNDAYNFAKHYFENGNFKNQYLKLFNN
jgi:glycosyltransferase involved in cell wall biosynthesis